MLVLAYLLAGSADLVGPGLRATLAWLGLAVLAWFALQALRTAFGTRAAPHLPQTGQETSRRCIGRVLAVVWLNPLTYLELLLVPAAISGTFAVEGARLRFLTATLLMAAVSCYGYAFGGSLFSLALRRQIALRAFDFISGVLLTLLAMSMAASLIVTSH